MSDRFISGGTIDADGEATEKGPEAGAGMKQSLKNSEWEAVQKELEAERRRRDEQRIKAASGEEKSLYEILQANKEAKQAAFEEQNKIRNQFRALDDDEIDFLDEVRERQRKEEESKRRELEDGLKAFREARKVEGVPSTNADEGKVEEEGTGESWEVGGRNRKRGKGSKREVKGVRRKVDDGGKSQEAGEKVETESEVMTQMMKTDDTKSTTQVKSTTGSAGGSKALGLVGYGSDDSDEE